MSQTVQTIRLWFVETKVKLNISRTDVYFLAFIVVSTRHTGKATHISTDEKSSWHIHKKKVNFKMLYGEMCMNIFLYSSCIPPVMLFIFNLHTFIFSPLFMFEVEWTNKKWTSFGDMNKQTEKMTKSLMDFFTSSLAVVAFLYRLCCAYTYDSFSLTARKTFSWNRQTYNRTENKLCWEEEFVSKVINWKICFVFVKLFCVRKFVSTESLQVFKSKFKGKHL